MLKVRKGIAGEEDKVLECADNTFKPYRFEGFSFKKVMPRIYNSGYSFANMHHVVENDNGKIVATAGNPIRYIMLDGEKYYFSSVGTVATLKEYEGMGCMRMIMDSIASENKSSGVAFSLLTGERGRYNNYGYEKAATRNKYFFNDYFSCHYKPINRISCKEYNESELDEYYEIYLKSQPVIIREKKDFISSLKRRFGLILGFYEDNSLIGYLSYSMLEECVSELSLSKLSLLYDVIGSTYAYLKVNKLCIIVSSLDTKLNSALDKLADSYEIENKLHIKIYDLKRFMDMLIRLNLKYRELPNLNECYKIDDEIIRIEIKDNRLIALEINNNLKYDFSFDSKNFVYNLFNLKNLSNSRPKLFPLYFSLTDPDLF